MSILIKGMKMPKEGDVRLKISAIDGKVYVFWRGDCLPTELYEVIELPPHGKLIDADALTELVETEF